MKTIIVYSGRFQPFHKGHKASYDHLVKKFKGDVYIVSAEKAAGPSDPFTWIEKKKLAVSTGVPADRFVKVKNGYVLQFLKDAGLPIDDDTIVILALSEKDGSRLVGKNVDKQGYAIKKNGERAAIQWLPKKPKPVSSGHIYAYVTPTVDFKVAGETVRGATQIRDMYANSSEMKRKEILIDLYGRANVPIKRMFDKKLNSMQTEAYLREYIEFINNF